MKRYILIVLLALGLLLGTTSGAWGCGVFGATDLMYTPTARTLDAGSLGISVNINEADTGYFNFDYGLFSDLEVGIVVLPYHDDHIIRFRGKYNILQEDRNTPRLSIGVEDLGPQSNISPYIVLSKAFPGSSVQGHIGVGGGDLHGVFGGLGVIFTNGSGRSVKQTELFLEFDSHEVNVGAKLGIGANTKINFGLTDLDNWMVGVTFLMN